MNGIVYQNEEFKYDLEVNSSMHCFFYNVM